MKIFNCNIDFKSFFKKGCKKMNEEFGVYAITGQMGSGKTYLGIYLLSLLDNKFKVYTNIHSYKNKNKNIEFFEKLEEVWDSTEPNCVFLIDELSARYTRDSKCENKFYRFLQHSRKANRYVLLITQDYQMIPPWLRHPISRVYTTHKCPFLPIFITDKGLPVLLDEKSWSIETEFCYIYKRNMSISSQYDTFENVPIL